MLSTDIYFNINIFKKLFQKYHQIIEQFESSSAWSGR